MRLRSGLIGLGVASALLAAPMMVGTAQADGNPVDPSLTAMFTVSPSVQPGGRTLNWAGSSTSDTTAPINDIYITWGDYGNAFCILKGTANAAANPESVCLDSQGTTI